MGRFASMDDRGMSEVCIRVAGKVCIRAVVFVFVFVFIGVGGTYCVGSSFNGGMDSGIVMGLIGKLVGDRQSSSAGAGVSGGGSGFDLGGAGFGGNH